jgi:hypothetical protein
MRILPALSLPHQLRAAAMLALALLAAWLVVPPAASVQDLPVTVELRPGNGTLSGGRRWDPSGVTGTAILTARGDQTLVELVVRGAPGDHPDHIHRGRCVDPEPNPLYPLSDVVLNRADERGRSTTTVDVPLDELLAGEHLILIHRSAQEINVYLACGDIIAGDTDGRVQPPTAGVGTAVRGHADRELAAGLGLAFVLALAAVVTRRAARA